MKFTDIDYTRLEYPRKVGKKLVQIGYWTMVYGNKKVATSNHLRTTGFSRSKYHPHQGKQECYRRSLEGQRQRLIDLGKLK